MRRAIGMFGSLAIAGGILTGVAGPTGAAPTDRSPVPWSPPAWVRAAHPGDATVPTTASVTVRVYLHWRDLAGAQAMARAVSDPSNPAYRHTLTAPQVRAAYGPSVAAEQRVSHWLADAGLTVGSVPTNALYVPATGSTAAVGHAFGTTIANYSLKGRRLHAATSAPSTPASVVSDISGVSGLDSNISRRTPGTTRDRDRSAVGASPSANDTAAPAATPAVAPPGAGFRNAPPCSKFWAEKLDTTDPKFKGVPNPMPYVPCGYLPSQLRSAYGIDHAVADGNDGSGVRVAVVDAYASPTLRSDAKTYARRYDPNHPLLNSKYSQLVFPETDPSLESPDQCDASGWYGDQTVMLTPSTRPRSRSRKLMRNPATSG